MLNLKKEVRDIHRFNKIIFILAQQGFGHLFDKLKFKKFKSKTLVDPKRLRKTFEKLGPTFVKLGQILSLRPDLVPKEYVKELGSLQSEVPPFSYKEVEEIIKKELHNPIKKLFASFGSKPIASASISQVHKATLKNGTKVAVKVQRPNVKEIMDTDVEIMYYIAGLLEKHSEKIKRFELSKIVKEFKEWTDNELDFENEAKNAKTFYKNFEGSTTVKIPRTFDKYSTKRILTLEFIDGIELHNIKKIKEKKCYNIDIVIKNGFNAGLTMVFIHGLFHADPHPGNILVLKGDKIALVDFGIVGYFDKDLRKKSISLFYGVVEENTDYIVDTFLDMGLTNQEQSNIDLFKEGIRGIIEPLQKSSVKDVKVSYVLEEVLDLALKHHVRMPLDFVLFGKTIIELEGIALEYDPSFKFVENSRPFLEKLIKNEFKPVSMAKDLAKNLFKYGRLFRDLPDQLSSALRRIQKGSIKVDVDDTDIKKLGMDIDRSSNRMTYGMIIAAFLVTGALLTNVGEMAIGGFSIASLVSFSMTIIFSLVLFISIRKEGKE